MGSRSAAVSSLCILIAVCAVACEKKISDDTNRWPLRLEAVAREDVVHVSLRNQGGRPIQTGDIRRNAILPTDSGMRVLISDQSKKSMPLCAMVDPSENYRNATISLNPQSEVGVDYRISTLAVLYCLNPGRYEFKFIYEFGGGLGSLESNSVNVRVPSN